MLQGICEASELVAEGTSCKAGCVFQEKSFKVFNSHLPKTEIVQLGKYKQECQHDTSKGSKGRTSRVWRRQQGRPHRNAS